MQSVSIVIVTRQVEQIFYFGEQPGESGASESRLYRYSPAQTPTSDLLELWRVTNTHHGKSM